MMFNPVVYSFRVFINGKWVTFFVRQKDGRGYYSVQTDHMNEALQGTDVMAEMEKLGAVPMSYANRTEEMEELEKMLGIGPTDEDD